MTPNISQRELEYSATAVRHGLKNVTPPELLLNLRRVANVLQTIRDHYDKPLRVLSGYRSPAVNVAVGGSRTSAHMKALAADIRVIGVSVLEVCQWCADNIPNFDQIIYEFGESGWCHIGLAEEGKTPRKELLTAKKVANKTVMTSGLIMEKKG
jgi:zinc D-Ala-D-Ala carboxypeptidase